jgi:hypothetical protein
MSNNAADTIDLEARHVRRVFLQYEAKASKFLHDHLGDYPVLVDPVLMGLEFFFLSGPKTLSLAAWDMTAQATIQPNGSHHLRYALLDCLDKLQYTTSGFGVIQSETSQEVDGLIQQAFFEIQVDSIDRQVFLAEPDKQASAPGALLAAIRDVMYCHPEHPSLRSPVLNYQAIMSQLPYQILRYLIIHPQLFQVGEVIHDEVGSRLHLITPHHRYAITVNQTLFAERLKALYARLARQKDTA